MRSFRRWLCSDRDEPKTKRPRRVLEHPPRPVPTLRYMSKLHHIGIGRAHKHRPIKLLIADRDIRIIDPETGELLRELTLDPTRDYQPINNT
jgi:hypothetical protein